MKKLLCVFALPLIIVVGCLSGCSEDRMDTVTKTSTATITTTATLTSTTVISTVTTTKLIYPVEDILWVMDTYGDAFTYTIPVQYAEFTLYLDSSKGEFSGNVGINRYWGHYKLEGNQLSFPDRILAVTQAYQGESLQQQQEEYLSIFMNSDTCEVVDGKLHITDEDRWIIFYRQ
ncbi:MAG: META domain-containing protein [Dehalococcoidales bacterium]|nr:META domain-containing protein [Dehalococcoidales bacterium]